MPHAITADPAFYRALVDGCPDAIVVADRDGVIRFWNAAAEATFGHPAADAIGQPLDILIPERLRARHRAGYEAVVRSGRTRYGGDLLKVPALHRDGTRLSIEFRIALLRDRTGRVTAIAAFMRDVTAAWKEQQALRDRLRDRPVAGVGPIHRFLADEHARLDRLLAEATATPDAIDGVAYARFRAGLLKHIAMEETVLLPDAERRHGGAPLPVAATLRLGHRALAALLMPFPTHAIAAAIRSVLATHNAIEDAAGGVYAACERLGGPEAAELLARLRRTPDVPVPGHVDSFKVRSRIRRALRRAGFPDEAASLFRTPDDMI